MTAFVATLGPKLASNWDICKKSSQWGIIGRGSNWRAGANKVSVGDEIFVWRGGKPNGFIAMAEATGTAEFVGPGVRVPWPEPQGYGAVVPIRVVRELVRPEGDSFAPPSRVGSRFGFNNTVLQHMFEAVSQEQGGRIREVFMTSAPIGVLYHSPPPPMPISGAEPFSVDPDIVDRGLLAHHETVDRLARWVRRRSLLPLLPGPMDPAFDLAWYEGTTLHVAEVKSVTSKNEESQLRLGLGQVLRYRQLLRARVDDVQGWLVPERQPTDMTWAAACSDVDVTLLVP